MLFLQTSIRARLQAALLITALLAMPLAAQARTAQPNSQLWTVGQKRLFLSCSGTPHGPTVVFEAGHGRPGSDWSKVQPAVSAYTRACSYDRAAYGQSPAPTASFRPDEDAAQTIEDLHNLLTAANIPPPYILVGHSLGGLYVRLYQARYPNEVKGLVLVDPVHEESWHGLDIDPKATGPTATPEELRRSGFLPPRERSQWHADIPLIVLAHGQSVIAPEFRDKAAAFEANFLWGDHDLASRSRYGEVRIAEKSGHFIQFDQPDLVIQAIHDVWQKANQP